MAQIDKDKIIPPNGETNGKKNELPPAITILLAKARRDAKKNTGILNDTEYDIGITEKVIKEQNQGREA